MNKYKPYLRMIASAIAFVLICRIAGVYAGYLHNRYNLNDPIAIMGAVGVCALVVTLMTYILME